MAVLASAARANVSAVATPGPPPDAGHWLPGRWASPRPWPSRRAADSPGRAGDRLRAPEPAMTTAIVHRRTMDHLGCQMTATEVDLGADAIDAADGRSPSALCPPPSSPPSSPPSAGTDPPERPRHHGGRRQTANGQGIKRHVLRGGVARPDHLRPACLTAERGRRALHPGARSARHSHHGGETLSVAEGGGLGQVHGDDAVALHAGDVVDAPTRGALARCHPGGLPDPPVRQRRRTALGWPIRARWPRALGSCRIARKSTRRLARSFTRKSRPRSSGDRASVS